MRCGAVDPAACWAALANPSTDCPTEETVSVTFADVAGIDEAKDEVHEIVEFLKSPEKFARLGGRIPRGVLLAGPPGCGKTLLAKAIAGEADVPSSPSGGSDFEMFVGVGANTVRAFSNKPKKAARDRIIFLNEIDAVGRKRAAVASQAAATANANKH